MPFDLADDLYQHLLDRFPADRDYPRGALYVEGMPPLVAGLLGRTLDRWLEHELDGLESRWFDFEDPAVRAARAELLVALGRTARVPRGSWAETLRYAVGLVVRHLSTPARALTDATFEGQPDPLPTDLVRARLHTFEAYSYLAEIADAYLAQKRPESVDPDTLHDLLLRVDRRVTADYGAEEWMRLLGPLFKLVRYVPDRRGLPAALLAQFFATKGREETAEALQNLGERVLDEAALRDLLVKTSPAGAAPAPAAAAAVQPASGASAGATATTATTAAESLIGEDGGTEEPEDADETSSADEAAEAMQKAVDDDDARDPDENASGVGDGDDGDVSAPAIIPRPDDESQPLWKRFTGGPTAETHIPAGGAPAPRTHSNIAPAGVVPPAPTDAQSPPAGEPSEEPVWRRFLTGLRGKTDDSPPDEGGASGEVPASSGTPSLDELEESVLGKAARRDRRRFVRDLFGGDEAGYATVLQRLGHCDSWTEASQVIARDVFRRYGVDIYSESAVAFTDAVNGQFDG